jgi:hypothetical protein
MDIGSPAKVTCSILTAPAAQPHPLKEKTCDATLQGSMETSDAISSRLRQADAGM